jgi:hypothetical protein
VPSAVTIFRIVGIVVCLLVLMKLLSCLECTMCLLKMFHHIVAYHSEFIFPLVDYITSATYLSTAVHLSVVCLYRLGQVICGINLDFFSAHKLCWCLFHMCHIDFGHVYHELQQWFLW